MDTPAVTKDELTAVPRSPAERLADKIMARLVKEGIVQSEQVASMLPKLVSGKLRPQDWRPPVEIALEKKGHKNE